ncbi:hypothetical protein HYW17_00230 [Candidatus Uhrbacteria bacterium]|nr:hypothetical protein [Candidatus Uhrbacteria bacterium]
MKLRPTVLKYGGSAVGDPQRLGVVAQDVITQASGGQGVVVVVSAMGDETDELFQFMANINPTASRAVVDMVVQTGEVKAVGALAAAIERRGGQVVAFTSQQVGFSGTEDHGSARLLQVRGVRLIRQALAEGKIVVVPGFQAVTRTGSLVTLGRGGSNLTAVALAVVLKAAFCVFKTDVDGLSPVDPDLVTDPIIFPELDYDAACDVSQDRVIVDRAIKLAQAYGIPLRVMRSPSIGSSTGGTIIRNASTHDALEPEPRYITVVSADLNLALVKILGVPDRPGQAAKLFKAGRGICLSDAIQAEGTGQRAVISFLVSMARLSEALAKVRRVHRNVQGREGYVGLTVFDRRMRREPDYVARVTGALANARVNISLISTSGPAITVGIKATHLSRAARAVADEFGLRRKAV